MGEIILEFNNMKFYEIKDYFNSLSIEKYPNFIKLLQEDSRITVQNYAISVHKKYLNYLNEKKRIEKLKYYENKAFSRGYNLIAGIDEVGRGPLAGPVVSAAVILPKDFNVLHINDSKKITPKKREELYNKIQEYALDVGVGIVNSQIIDDINIYQATKMSMAIAVNNLKNTPDILFIDAMKCENIPIKQLSIIKGDSRSISIAAASIIAKVTRDRIMEEYHKKFPQYAFNKNKGYGTEEHRDAIIDFGFLNIHRKTFLKKIIGS